MNLTQSKRLIGVFILEILKNHSDEHQKLKQKDIIEYLRKDYQMVVDRKTVLRNLQDLIACGEFDIEYREVIRKSRPDSEDEEATILTDLWLVHDFSESEYQMLVDSILYSRHITASQAKDLISHLGKTVSHGISQRTPQFHQCKSVYRTAEQDTFLNADQIRSAIDEKKQIRVIMREYQWNGRLEKKPGETITVTPYYLASANGFYYLIANNEDSGEIESIRIDRIDSVEKLVTTHGTPMRETEFRDTTLKKYMTSHPFLSSGKPVQAHVLIDEGCITDITDTFGDAIDILEMKDNRYTAAFYSTEEDLFRWALLHADHAIVLKPQHLRNRLRKAAKSLSLAYCVTNDDQVNAMVQKTADGYGILAIVSRDLTGQMGQIVPDSIQHLDLRNNTGCDMSFLKQQTKLVSITVSNQLFDHPDLLLSAPELEYVRLINTGMTDISVRGRLPLLKKVLLHERNSNCIKGLSELKGKEVIVSEDLAQNIDLDSLRAEGINIEALPLRKMIGACRETMFFREKKRGDEINGLTENSYVPEQNA